MISGGRTRIRLRIRIRRFSEPCQRSGTGGWLWMVAQRQFFSTLRCKSRRERGNEYHCWLLIFFFLSSLLALFTWLQSFLELYTREMRAPNFGMMKWNQQNRLARNKSDLSSTSNTEIEATWSRVKLQTKQQSSPHLCLLSDLSASFFPFKFTTLQQELKVGRHEKNNYANWIAVEANQVWAREWNVDLGGLVAPSANKFILG